MNTIIIPPFDKPAIFSLSAGQYSFPISKSPQNFYFISSYIFNFNGGVIIFYAYSRSSDKYVALGYVTIDNDGNYSAFSSSPQPSRGVAAGQMFVYPSGNKFFVVLGDILFIINPTTFYYNNQTYYPINNGITTTKINGDNVSFIRCFPTGDGGLFITYVGSATSEGGNWFYVSYVDIFGNIIYTGLQGTVNGSSNSFYSGPASIYANSNFLLKFINFSGVGIINATYSKGFEVSSNPPPPYSVPFNFNDASIEYSVISYLPYIYSENNIRYGASYGLSSSFNFDVNFKCVSDIVLYGSYILAGLVYSGGKIYLYNIPSRAYDGEFLNVQSAALSATNMYVFSVNSPPTGGTPYLLKVFKSDVGFQQNNIYNYILNNGNNNNNNNNFDVKPNSTPQPVLLTNFHRPVSILGKYKA